MSRADKILLCKIGGSGKSVAVFGSFAYDITWGKENYMNEIMKWIKRAKASKVNEEGEGGRESAYHRDPISFLVSSFLQTRFAGRSSCCYWVGLILEFDLPQVSCSYKFCSMFPRPRSMIIRFRSTVFSWNCLLISWFPACLLILLGF